MPNPPDSPLFSIITVVLNAGGLLEETVASVLEQSFPGFELIIKDGGSSDRSIRTLPDDRRIRLFIKPDKGIYDAMNQALEVASGHYILFLNAGDRFAHQGVLQEIAIPAEEGHAALIYSDYYKGNSGTLIRSPKKLTSSFLMRTMLCHQTCFFRRDSFEKYGHFNLEFKVAADYDFLVKTMHRHKLTWTYYPHPTICYRGGGFSIQNLDQSLQEVKQIRKTYFSSFRLFFFYLWYRLTFPKLRQQLIEKHQLSFYYKLTNFIKTGGK